jgi:membrane-associated phospholipid phosphatase
MEKIPLKAVLTHKNKTVCIISTVILVSLSYFLSGLISDRYAVFLPIGKFERDIPFLVWTIWIYIVLSPIYMAWAVLGVKSIAQMNKSLYSLIILTVLSCIVFILIPIAYPRDYFPLPPEKSFSILVFKIMRALDKPSNCLPSLHIGLCYLFAYGFYNENRKKFIISFGISTLIAISTLTTKQHYLYDIIFGFLIATSLFVFFNKFTVIIEKTK